MNREIGAEGLESTLTALSYPAVRTDAATELEGVTVVLEDRAVDLGVAISGTDADVFDAPAQLLAAVEAEFETSRQ